MSLLIPFISSSRGIIVQIWQGLLLQIPCTRDRKLQSFISSSFAFILILILRYVLDFCPNDISESQNHKPIACTQLLHQVFIFYIILVRIMYSPFSKNCRSCIQSAVMTFWTSFATFLNCNFLIA